MDIDVIIDLIIEGFSYRKIAEKMQVPLSTLHAFVSLPEHSARANNALQISAQTFDDKAEQVLIEAPADKNELQRARELAQHYRWKAAKRNPKKYGDKVDVTTDGQPINEPRMNIVIDGKDIKLQ